MAHLPKQHYPRVELRCVLPADEVTGEVGLAFNLAQGEVLRFRIGGDQARHLMTALAEDQRITGVHGSVSFSCEFDDVRKAAVWSSIDPKREMEANLMRFAADSGRRALAQLDALEAVGRASPAKTAEPAAHMVERPNARSVSFSVPADANERLIEQIELLNCVVAWATGLVRRQPQELAELLRNHRSFVEAARGLAPAVRSSAPAPKAAPAASPTADPADSASGS